MKNKSNSEGALNFLLEYICAFFVALVYPIRMIGNGKWFLGIPLSIIAYGGGIYLAAFRNDLFKIALIVYAVFILILQAKHIVDVKEFESLVQDYSNSAKKSGRSSSGPAKSSKSTVPPYQPGAGRAAYSGVGNTTANNTTNGAGSTAYNAGNTTYGAGSTAYNAGNTAYGAGSTAYGAGNTAYGAGSTAYGTGNTAYGAGSNTYGNGNNYNYQSTNNARRKVPKQNPYFHDMDEEEAKKEFLRLAKIYHPDNAEGDLEMFKEISEAYEDYKRTLVKN